jgi:hypothetical protein
MKTRGLSSGFFCLNTGMDKFTRYLTDFASGFVQGVTHPKGLLSNWRHATHLFVDDNYRLTPRSRFLFYVKFTMDKNAIRAPAFTAKHADEVGMLVKSSDLPKMTFNSITKNQYNRKKLLYTDVTYEPINIKLHDDADGVTNALWAQYFGYYCADRMTATSSKAYKATHYHPTLDPVDNYRFGLDNNITAPFFTKVTIYTMSRNRFLGYELVNPRIKKWDHGSMDHASNEMQESIMSLEYEAVRYLGGNVTTDMPGFASLHYDTTPSPLGVAGGGTASLTGNGGVLSGLEQIFGDVANGDSFSTLGGLISTAVKAKNTFDNFSKLTTAGVVSEVVGNITNPGLSNSARGTLATDYIMPILDAPLGTSATPKKMI